MNETVKIYLMSLLLFMISIYFLYQIYSIINKINVAKMIEARHRQNLEKAKQESYEKKEEARRLALILDDNITAS